MNTYSNNNRFTSNSKNRITKQKQVNIKNNNSNKKMVEQMNHFYENGMTGKRKVKRSAKIENHANNEINQMLAFEKWFLVLLIIFFLLLSEKW